MSHDSLEMLRATYQVLLLHQRAVAELMCATKALLTAVESNPKMKKPYQEQYAVLASGPARYENEKAIAQLEETIRRLTVQ